MKVWFVALTLLAATSAGAFEQASFTLRCTHDHSKAYDLSATASSRGVLLRLEETQRAKGTVGALDHCVVTRE